MRYNMNDRIIVNHYFKFKLKFNFNKKVQYKFAIVRKYFIISQFS